MLQKFQMWDFKIDLPSNWNVQHFLWNCPWVFATGHQWRWSTLILVMAWCLQSTSHYLNQCCHCFMIPYGKVQLIKNQIWNKSNGNFFKGINQPFTHCIVFWNINKNLYFVSWNPCLWRTGTYLAYVFHNIAADVLARLEVYFFRNILASAPEGLIYANNMK